MKERPNWVVVKTWWNADKGKYNKRPVNCNSDKGEYAESDNPETWTTFDNALKYLKEKGGTTVAYALDGKDNISCIDLDRCYLKPKGVLVWCEAEHTCMTCRGVRKPGTKTTTYCTRGEFTSEKVMQVLAVVK